MKRKRVAANVRAKEILPSGSVDDVKVSVPKYVFGGFGESRTPVQYVLNGRSQFLKLNMHFVFIQCFLEHGDGKKGCEMSGGRMW